MTDLISSVRRSIDVHLRGDLSRPRVVGPVAVGPVAVASLALGSLAIGAVAVGAIAVGAVAIGRLVVRKAVLRELEAGNVHIRTLAVDELEVGGRRWPAES